MRARALVSSCAASSLLAIGLLGRTAAADQTLTFDEDLRVGVRLVISVTAPTAWEPLELPAEVRWTDGRGAGVAVRSLTPTQVTERRSLV